MIYEFKPLKHNTGNVGLGSPVCKSSNGLIGVDGLSPTQNFDVLYSLTLFLYVHGDNQVSSDSMFSSGTGSITAYKP